MGKRTSNVSSDVMTAGNMGCLVATDGSKSSDDCAVKRVCSGEHWMFRVDAHHHLWDLAVRDQPWIAGAALAPLRRSFGVEDLAEAARGIDATVLVQTVTVPEETPDLLALAAAHELIAGVVGWVDLTAPDVADALAALDGEWLVGIRHQVQGEPDPRWLCRDDVRRGLRAVARRRPRLRPADDPGRSCRRRSRPCARSTTSSSSSTTSPSRRSRAASSSRGPRTCARWPRTRTSSASSRGWSPRRTGTRGRVDDLRPYAETVLDAFGPERRDVRLRLAGLHARRLLRAGASPPPRRCVGPSERAARSSVRRARRTYTLA